MVTLKSLKDAGYKLRSKWVRIRVCRECDMRYFGLVNLSLHAGAPCDNCGAKWESKI